MQKLPDTAIFSECPVWGLGGGRFPQRGKAISNLPPPPGPKREQGQRSVIQGNLAAEITDNRIYSVFVDYGSVSPVVNVDKVATYYVANVTIY
ncbi:MAG: hypothetical protein PVJ39_12085 [Gammaproteobacteria bacterium]|jgi:hypothetical protein